MATAVYVLLTVGILWASTVNASATRKLLEASQRPYLGVILVQLNPIHSSYAELSAAVKNVGNVPSRYIKIDLHVSLNGSPFKAGSAGPDIALLPAQTYVLNCVFTGEDLRPLNPPQKIEVSIQITYEGMTRKEYRTETTCRFTAVGKPFALLSATME
jgi:hypothetical protein